MTRQAKAAATAAGLVAIAALTALKVHNMLQRGEPVFWLAELWAPAAFLSIGLVTCLEFLMGPDSPPPKARRRRKKA